MGQNHTGSLFQIQAGGADPKRTEQNGGITVSPLIKRDGSLVWWLQAGVGDRVNSGISQVPFKDCDQAW